jgi:type IV pilus assembly protein PilP
MKNMNKRTSICVLFLVLSGGLLSGCDNNDHLDDLRNYMNEVKKSNSTPVAAQQVAAPQLEKAITYKAAALRTPFHLTSGDTSDSTQPAATPLQSFPLSVLKFVGTSAEGETMTAYILTPNNMVFQVRKGDAIGEHYGKIISIQSGLLEIEERGTADDEKESRIVVLQLKDNNG